MNKLKDIYEMLSIEVGEQADKVATITVDRPDARNAMNSQVRNEFKEAVQIAEEDEQIRVVVITGSEGTSTFISGADVTDFKDRGVVEQIEAREWPRIYDIPEKVSIPVIARINGHAVGGGCELIQACDIRIAQSGSKIGQPEINLGLIPGGGGSQRLPRLVGKGQAMKMILSGELIDAKEAQEIGLIEEVHPSEELDEAVYDLAGTIAEKSPLALEYAKKAIKMSSRVDLHNGIQYESDLFVKLFATEDKDEGIEAFLEGRDPDFIGR